MLSSYITAEYYTETYKGTDVPAEELERRIDDVSRHIDSLTFNRIVAAGGLDNLTAFQQEIIQRVCCRQMDFEYENEDLITAVLSEYAINGVSMKFSGSSWNMHVENGVVMRKDLYETLKQTGLCTRIIGRW